MIKIKENTYWVGKVDNRKVPFHRLILEKGTTYNSYLLHTEKPTLIDTVDILYGREFVENLSKAINLDALAYIVINHVEPDHAGALPALLAKAKNAVIVTTQLGKTLLEGMFRIKGRKFLVVRSGDTLDIGGKTLRFFEVPYLHTEETMVTYVVEDKILYSCDIFSTHIANEELFNDLAKEDITEDFKVYYQLIMHPHRPYVIAMLDVLKRLPIEMIAPSHGYILRDNPQRYIDLYASMSSLDKDEKKNIIIAYSSVTGNTAFIASELKKALEQVSINARLFNLEEVDLVELAKEASKVDGLLVGSATKYADMVGKTEEFLSLLRNSIEPKGVAAAFGSYGWSGEAVVHVQEQLKEAGYTVIDQNYLIKATGVDKLILPLRLLFRNEEYEGKIKEAAVFFSEIVRNRKGA